MTCGVSLRGWLSLCVITRHFPPCLCEADVVSRSNLGGAVKEIPKKSGKLRGKPLTRWRDMIYIICQLKGRRKVCKVPGLERTVRIRRCSGGVYPRLIFTGDEACGRGQDPPLQMNECSSGVYPRLVGLKVSWPS